MVLQVYLDPCTVNSRKVLAGLDLVGVPYNFNYIDYFKGEQKSSEFTKINPMQTVPAAVDGSLTLTESNAILQYAADLNPSSAYPKDLQRRADVNRCLLWEASSWFPSCYVLLVEYIVKPLLGSQPDQSVIDGALPTWNKLAGVLEGQLQKTGAWLTGPEVTIADISVAASVHLHRGMQLPFDKYPAFQAWLRKVEALKCWQDTQSAVEKSLLPNGYEGLKANGAKSGTAANGTSKSVRALFNYTKDVQPRLTELYFYESDKAAGIHEPGDDPQEMGVYDGWHRVNEFSADKHGFSLHDFHTDFTQWDNDDATAKQFYPEVVEFLKKTTGAKRVLVFDHTIRTKANDTKKITQETNTSQRAPVMLVHCDYTSESGPTRVKQLLGSEADELLSRRVAFLNVWKPIHNTVEERPLAMCDVSSAPKEDFFKLHLRYRDRNGENYVMRHNEAHKWWYFPKMTTDKVILLKTYDSETDGRARFVGHSAFDDPETREDAPVRESVEIRTIAFF